MQSLRQRHCGLPIENLFCQLDNWTTALGVVHHGIQVDDIASPAHCIPQHHHVRQIFKQQYKDGIYLNNSFA